MGKFTKSINVLKKYQNGMTEHVNKYKCRNGTERKETEEIIQQIKDMESAIKLLTNHNRYDVIKHN